MSTAEPTRSTRSNYIASNPDLIQAFGPNPAAAQQHYIVNGFNEHRATNSFNAAQYLANYPDLAAAFGNDLTAAKRHYITTGYTKVAPTTRRSSPEMAPTTSLVAKNGQS